MISQTVHLVSLGDSIATGTQTPFSRTYSYVFYLQRKLGEMGCRPRFHSLAHDGDTSHDLLWKLRHAQPFRRVVEQADWITVSIGGNDLLRASSIPGFARINQPMAKRGVRDFTGNWPLIIEEITALNPQAAIVVLNLYNPYNHTHSDRKLFEITDQFLTQINQTIAAHAKNRYRIADTYSAFLPYSKGRMHKVSCLYPESVMRNPHPTPQAQKMIADLVLAQFEWQRSQPAALRHA